MEFFLQDTSFLLLILAIIGLMGVLIGWSLRSSLSERPILEAYERLEQDRNSLARLFAQLKDQHELRSNEIKKLQLEITQLRQEVTAFEVEKATRKSNAETYAVRLEKAEAEAAHYAEKIVFLEEQARHIRSRNVQLHHDTERLREELRAWMTLHRDFAGLQQQMKDLEQINTRLEQERLYFQQQLGAARIEVEHLQLQVLRTSTSTGHPLGTVAAASDEIMLASPTQPAEMLAASDDLKLINGITPFAEQQLRAIGVHNFEQISIWDEQTVNAVAAALDCPPEKIRNEDWVGQARQLVKTTSRKKR